MFRKSICSWKKKIPRIFPFTKVSSPKVTHFMSMSFMSEIFYVFRWYRKGLVASSILINRRFELGVSCDQNSCLTHLWLGIILHQICFIVRWVRLSFLGVGLYLCPPRVCTFISRKRNFGFLSGVVKQRTSFLHWS